MCILLVVWCPVTIIHILLSFMTILANNQWIGFSYIYISLEFPLIKLLPLCFMKMGKSLSSNKIVSKADCNIHDTICSAQFVDHSGQCVDRSGQFEYCSGTISKLLRHDLQIPQARSADHSGSICRTL